MDASLVVYSAVDDGPGGLIGNDCVEVVVGRLGDAAPYAAYPAYWPEASRTVEQISGPGDDHHLSAHTSYTVSGTAEDAGGLIGDDCVEVVVGRLGDAAPYAAYPSYWPEASRSVGDVGGSGDDHCLSAHTSYAVSGTAEDAGGLIGDDCVEVVVGRLGDAVTHSHAVHPSFGFEGGGGLLPHTIYPCSDSMDCRSRMIDGDRADLANVPHFVYSTLDTKGGAGGLICNDCVEVVVGRLGDAATYSHTTYLTPHCSWEDAAYSASVPESSQRVTGVGDILSSHVAYTSSDVVEGTGGLIGNEGAEVLVGRLGDAEALSHATYPAVDLAEGVEGMLAHAIHPNFDPQEESSRLADGDEAGFRSAAPHLVHSAIHEDGGAGGLIGDEGTVEVPGGATPAKEIIKKKMSDTSERIVEAGRRVDGDRLRDVARLRSGVHRSCGSWAGTEGTSGNNNKGWAFSGNCTRGLEVLTNEIAAKEALQGDAIVRGALYVAAVVA